MPLVKSDDLDDVPPLGRRLARTQDHELVTSHGQWGEAVQGYLASVSYCDHVIGEIVNALDSSPAAANTAVVLWGDNGFHLGEKLHWRKFVLWEEATRVPLIAVVPNQPRQRRVHQPVGLVDLFPTILELCDLPPEDEIDGRSLTPLLREEREHGRSPAVMTWERGNHSVRSTRWRFTRYRDGGKELYDHQVDSYEWTNLASLPEFADVCRRMARWLPGEGHPRREARPSAPRRPKRQRSNRG